MNDTIAAIATPEGKSAIAVVRISGTNVKEIIHAIVRPHYVSVTKIKPWRTTTAKIVHPVSGDILDEVLVTYFRCPKSFTGEDMVEINCHGNPFIVQAILNIILISGARLAEPGEFTRRAFENGRIDLSKAEAIAQMTISESAASRKRALQILSGGLSEPVQKARDQITDIRSRLELDLDFPEEYCDVSSTPVMALLKAANMHLQNLVDSGSIGDQHLNPRNVVIAGPVNAGKSTLFNQLTGRKRAIVSEEPGTTRDAIETTADWNGCSLSLIDTAGIRESISIAETMAVQQTVQIIQQASLIIYVVDGSSPSVNPLNTVIHVSPESNIVVFWNKNDLVTPDELHLTRFKSCNQVVDFITGSAKHGIGIQALRQKIISVVSQTTNTGQASMIMITTRQKNALEKTLNLIRECVHLYSSDVDPECIIPVLKDADYQLGLILGDTVSPDILTHIFSKFCIGK